LDAGHRYESRIGANDGSRLAVSWMIGLRVAIAGLRVAWQKRVVLREADTRVGNTPT
jgi:hypothetical protein